MENGEFNDPVLRCDSCNKLIRLTTLHKVGACDSCGNKRMRNLQRGTEEEFAQIKAWGFGKFLKEFELTDE